MKPHIIFGALALFAAAVLFATYGTALLSAPFASVPLNGPIAADSDGEFTVVADTESRRALIINADGDLTGVINCTTVDSPVDAITDVCVADGRIYVAGVRFAPDSDVIAEERVAVYNKGGNLAGVIFSDKDNKGEIPDIKSLGAMPGGVAVAYVRDAETRVGEAAGQGAGQTSSQAPGQDSAEDFLHLKEWLALDFANSEGVKEIGAVKTGDVVIHDAAVSGSDAGDGYRYATLSIRGVLEDGESSYASTVYTGHTYTSVDIDEVGTLYACDDATGALYAIRADSEEPRMLLAGEGYHSVHENDGVISLCNSDNDTVTICDTSGNVKSAFSEVGPSIGFSVRMVVIWASGLYLIVLVVVLAVRKLRRLVKEGRAGAVGPVLLAVAVVSAIALAIGSFSYSSYQKQLELRANEINMCADYLGITAYDLSEPMEKASDRNAFRTVKDDDEAVDVIKNLVDAAGPAMTLVASANNNGIGMYFSVYGKDDKGIFYVYGSSNEYAMGTSARGAQDNGLKEAFELGGKVGSALLTGRTLRDAAQYRLVQIPSSDGKSVAGVIEIGSKMRSFESSVAGSLAQRIVALLVLMLVVYLGYTELRACGRCLILYRKRQKKDEVGAIATLTRPVTLAVTMLSSIDSVMTVLIARDMLAAAGVEDVGPLLAIPPVMLGVGMVIGQVFYAKLGSRVGLRRLMAGGAVAMLACAVFTIMAVASGVYWMYCVAKLTMSIPFGMLYTLGYSLQRMTRNPEERAEAAGGVKRTDTSAAALGTVLGGYAAQGLGDLWVYVLVALACLPVLALALKLLPRGMRPAEELVQADRGSGRLRSFLRTTPAIALALLVVVPAFVARGYSSFLFPLFSSDLGLEKSDINNIVVLGQLVVFMCIGIAERIEGRYGKWRATRTAIVLLGVVFLLFAINTTLVWSVAVVVIVGLLTKVTVAWRGMWQGAAGEAGVPAGQAVSAMFATRSLALVIQPAILSVLLGATNSFAVIVIGLICLVCAGLFTVLTRRTSLAK